MSRRNSNLRNVNLIAVIFFILASVFYLVHEKYPFLRKQAAEASVAVVTVHDGDTVSVITGGKREKVRLIGIDAPELGQKPWGYEAKRHIEKLLDSSGWEVTMEFDQEKRDKYGRLLAYLRLADGKLLNLLMLKDGYAFLYTVPPNVKYVNELKEAQREAREAKLGIWSAEGLKEPPADYRRENPRI
jgi:micrococcal nuclease